MEVAGPLIIIAVLIAVLVIAAMLLREHLLLVIIAAFIYGAGANLQNRTMLMATIGFAFLAVVLFLVYLLLRHDRKRREFLRWLKDHAEDLRVGPVDCGGHRISLDDTVTQFAACVSLFFATFELQSKYLLRGERTRGVSALCSATTLIAGWWGLPEGPLLSFRALRSNFRGGEQHTMRALLRVAEDECSRR
jgi:membrane protein implicated in regulation of membrane protease activity